MAQVRGRGKKKRGGYQYSASGWSPPSAIIFTLHPHRLLTPQRRFRSPRLERVQREGLFKKVNERCKRQRACPYCGAYNGTVK